MCEPLGVGGADLRIEFLLMFVRVVRFCPFGHVQRDEQSAESLLSAQRSRLRWMPYWMGLGPTSMKTEPSSQLKAGAPLGFEPRTCGLGVLSKQFSDQQ